MKRLAALCLFLLAASTAHAQRRHGVEQFQIDAPAGVLAHATSPCDDSLFVALKARPAESWTASERAYVERLSVECSATVAADTTAAAGLAPPEVPAPRTTPSLLPVIGIALAAVLVYLVIHNSIKPDLSGIGPLYGGGPAHGVTPAGPSSAAPLH